MPQPPAAMPPGEHLADLNWHPEDSRLCRSEMSRVVPAASMNRAAGELAPHLAERWRTDRCPPSPSRAGKVSDLCSQPAAHSQTLRWHRNQNPPDHLTTLPPRTP